MLQSLKSVGVSGKGLDGALNKILQELQSRKTVVLTGAAANTAIALANITINDTVESAIQFAAGVPSDVLANISIVDLRATGTLTLTGIIAGDVVGVNGRNYTATTWVEGPVTGPVGAGKFVVGATDALTAASLAKAINAVDNTVTASPSTNVVTITAVTAGVAGNSIALVVTGSNAHAVRSGAVLTGGSATNGIKCSSNTTGNTLMLTWLQKPLANI